MRPLLPGDLDFAVRALLARPRAEWRSVVTQLLEEAGKAHGFRQSQGRPHPHFGTGSVMSAAARHELAALPPTCDPVYCSALREVLDVVLSNDLAQGT